MTFTICIFRLSKLEMIIDKKFLEKESNVSLSPVSLKSGFIELLGAANYLEIDKKRLDVCFRCTPTDGWTAERRRSRSRGLNARNINDQLTFYGSSR